jgi:hypothetical protein
MLIVEWKKTTTKNNKNNTTKAQQFKLAYRV